MAAEIGKRSAPTLGFALTASEKRPMASWKQHDSTSRTGKFMRAAFAGLVLVLTLPCHARPSQPQGNHPQFQNNQQPHLGTWLQEHGNLSPEAQEKALQSEPGFSRLSPETQQKLLDRLRQINRMPPKQRQRTVDHIEAMERLSPQMRQEVRSSLQEYRTLPEDRQRLMRKALRDLREYPPEQRAAMMNSGQFQAQFTPQERSILSNVLAVEPYEPMHGSRPGDGLEYGH
jgi:DNA-directed RNA polymerase subunit F